MAKAGRKPKAAALKLAEGSKKIQSEDELSKLKAAVEKTKLKFGKPRRPDYLGKEAREAWDRWIEPAFWLDATREPVAIAFCELWGQFRENPAAFSPAKHNQLRAYQAELGLTDERNRLPPPEEDKEDEFFA